MQKSLNGKTEHKGAWWRLVCRKCFHHWFEAYVNEKKPSGETDLKCEICGEKPLIMVRIPPEVG